MSLNATEIGQGIGTVIYVVIFFYLFFSMATRRKFTMPECIAWGIAGCIPGINFILFVILLLIRPRLHRATGR
jgi:hypothetical protein